MIMIIIMIMIMIMIIIITPHLLVRGHSVMCRLEDVLDQRRVDPLLALDVEQRKRLLWGYTTPPAPPPSSSSSSLCIVVIIIITVVIFTVVAVITTVPLSSPKTSDSAVVAVMSLTDLERAPCPDREAPHERLRILARIPRLNLVREFLPPRHTPGQNLPGVHSQGAEVRHAWLAAGTYMFGHARCHYQAHGILSSPHSMKYHTRSAGRGPTEVWMRSILSFYLGFDRSYKNSAR
jgi:hypothetical protein